MYTFLPSFEIIHKYNENHLMCKCKISDLLQGASENKIINWKHNRPPDTVRCRELAEYIYNKKQEVDWLFYMIVENDIFHIIDGIHRFHSLQIIKRENSKAPDYLTPILIGSTAFCANTIYGSTMVGTNNSADWLYEKYIFISLRKNMSNGETVDLFQSLNKSNPVPELYIAPDINQQKRALIETVVNEWLDGFNTHFTSSKNPNIPNMNRDKFIDILDFVYEKYKLNNSTNHLLTERLYELNSNLKANPPKKTSQSALDKCNKTGCFIFLIGREKLQFCI
jgi:hypothetical protein